MRLVCPNCGAQYEVDAGLIPEAGRDVQCSNCGNTWFQPHPENDLELSEDLGRPEPETTQTVTQTEPEPEPEEPKLVTGTSASALDILREEAAREMAERRSEGEALESQPDLGLDTAPPAPQPSDRKSRMARLRGEPEPRVDASGHELPPSRSSDLPDIEELNTSLDPERKRKPKGPKPVDPAQVEEERRGFRLGFTVMVAAAVILVVLYIYAPLIIQQMPSSEPAIIAYVDWANTAREGIDRVLARSADGLNSILERFGAEG